MGSTLTHGVYLPDEGERNCYSGLASNWSILDGAVGTIAEHTTALAGKAPAVHTHTKSDITDFPALANVATSGSYNDLSNIPASFTPSSHTHGNLTNDGKIGTTANKPLITGTDGAIQAGAFGTTAGTFCEGNDSRLSDARTPVAHTHTKSDVTDLLNSDFIPSANNSYDLGSSSYQWNNVYSKGYYYNGTPWGLDKENTWTNSNYFQGNLYQKSGTPGLVKGTIPSSVTYYGAFRHYTNSNQEINLFRGYIGTTGDNCFRWTIGSWVSGSAGRFQMRVSSDGTVRAFEVDGTEVSPFTNNATDLGTSTNKWKSLNGINPGLLSFPGTGGFTDIKGDITNLSGGDNTFTAPYNGWVCVRSTNATVIHIINTNWAVSQSATRSTAGTLCCLCPVMSGQSFRVIVNATSLEYAYIHPCAGNV